MKLELNQLSEETQKLIQAANQVISQLNQQGYEAYIVGGAVRNILLGKDINDIDITTNCLPEDMLKIFDRTVPVGIEHGTVLVLWDAYQFEVTTFRVDGEYVDHRRPEQVQFVTDLKSDLERRDFTINALAISESLSLIDYFNGQNDLNDKVIRAVGDANLRFQEDALRMMRAMRFQSVLDFEIEATTLQAMHQLASTIAFVSIERIIVEMKKLIQGKGVNKALALFYQSMSKSIPFFQSIKSDTALYQIQKPIHFNVYIAYIIYSERKFGQDLNTQLKNLKLSNVDKKNIKDCVAIFEYFNRPEQSLKTFVYQYDVAWIEQVVQFIKNENLVFDCLVEYEVILKISEQLPIQSRAALQINGNLLMQSLDKKPGPWLKKLLIAIEIEVIEGRLENQQHKILEWAKQYV